MLLMYKLTFSTICHVIYPQNFSDTWPAISPTSESFTASCIPLITDHFLWFFHFLHLMHQAYHAMCQARSGPIVKPPAFGDMATFFAICVWLTPLFLFLSLGANNSTLPTAGEPHFSPTSVAFSVLSN
jgi:hypothetical protein